ncbi:Phage integrase family protein [Soonwooa buanensis]|uniref:Phage integrase family protein n=1 Tax=Soonwooa buanensis TaxID=619805 RepID=A0A1T5FDL0_9FLAO|nr:phage integrase SAM-like domain-containing protein [Soonwooa buanensis]SKB94253.1 Phage integrase family protein [Soonwooa buanensis]
MATVKFIVQSESDNAPIYVRLSLSKSESFKRKTREIVNPKQWNSKKGTPINIQVGTKDIINQKDDLVNVLAKIERFIIEEYRKRSETDIINGLWLEETIIAFYSGGKRLAQLDFLDNYLEYYLKDVLPFRKNRGKAITESTIKKQKTIISKIQEFLKLQNKRLKVSDYDVKLSNKFEQFLEKQGISKNTIGRYVKYPKTIISHAKTLDIEVNEHLSEIKGYTTDTPTIYITESELQQIADITFLNIGHTNTKDWLIIGFYTGQRASDLLQMNKRQLIEIEGDLFINLSQKKTATPVLIPVHHKVKEILKIRNGNFPPTYSDNIESAKTIFNTNLRSIAKQANINRLEWGKKWNDETKRFDYGNYPLHEIISSHVCRRSFATHNYAKMPTPIIMAVTGHKTEKEFLNYIGKSTNDLSKQMFDYWRKEKGTEQIQQSIKTVN